MIDAGKEYPSKAGKTDKKVKAANRETIMGGGPHGISHGEVAQYERDETMNVARCLQNMGSCLEI
jgi:hypothetical protein